ncbi:DUF1080 domain-containing protein [Planctomycetota bacterium]
MKLFLSSLTMAIATLLVTTAVAEEANSLSHKEQTDGWKLLFDGKSMEHFRNYKKSDVGDGWKVVDGEIHWTKKNAGDIVTKEAYMAFEFKVDYKISPGGNSGLMYHVTEDGNTPWKTGPEIQIQDNKDGHDPQKAGWLYQLYKSETDATNPADEWNTLHILITPEKCVHWVNGTKYCEYVKGSDDWNQRVAKSKFGKMPLFGKPNNGHICLQDHGNVVAFRNIKVRRVSP